MVKEQIQDEVHMSDLEDQPVYKDPQAWSCTKALMKANLIMNDYFQIDETFSPATSNAERELISSLVGQFLYLQAACVYNWFYDLVETEAHLNG